MRERPRLFGVGGRRGVAVALRFVGDAIDALGRDARHHLGARRQLRSRCRVTRERSHHVDGVLDRLQQRRLIEHARVEERLRREEHRIPILRAGELVG